MDKHVKAKINFCPQWHAQSRAPQYSFQLSPKTFKAAIAAKLRCKNYGDKGLHNYYTSVLYVQQPWKVSVKCTPLSPSPELKHITSFSMTQFYFIPIIGMK